MLVLNEEKLSSLVDWVIMDFHPNIFNVLRKIVQADFFNLEQLLFLVILCNQVFDLFDVNIEISIVFLKNIFINHLDRLVLVNPIFLLDNWDQLGLKPKVFSGVHIINRLLNRVLHLVSSVHQHVHRPIQQLYLVVFSFHVKWVPRILFVKHRFLLHLFELQLLFINLKLVFRQLR